MSTTRQNILTTIRTTLTNAAIFQSIKMDKQPPTSLDTLPLPTCYIYSDRETRLDDEDAVIGKENWEWYVIIEVWALDKDLEDILNSVHTAMYNNRRFDNYAAFSERMGVDFATVDTDMRLESMTIPYRILYRHTLGTM